jgi:hypothetical protein
VHSRWNLFATFWPGSMDVPSHDFNIICEGTLLRTCTGRIMRRTIKASYFTSYTNFAKNVSSFFRARQMRISSSFLAFNSICEPLLDALQETWIGDGNALGQASTFKPVI